MKRCIIVYSIPDLSNGSGMERVLTAKANYLAELGYEVHVITSEGDGSRLYFPLHPKVKLHSLNINIEGVYNIGYPLHIWLRTRKMHLFRKRMSCLLHQLKPDITLCLSRRDVNFINRMTDGSIKVGEMHFDKQHYISYASPRWSPSCISTFIQRRRIKELGKLRMLVTLTHEDKAAWTEIDNLYVIPNPVSFSSDTVSALNQKQVIAVGRYVEQKGFDNLITIWSKVHQRHPDWVLKIYGEGVLREALQRQVDELQLSDTCLLEHAVPDIQSMYLESSIFALSSNYEGFGLVIVEAMSCGLPVVSFACPCGPRDIITSGKNGLLIEPHDLDGFAEGICRLIEDEELRQRMGTAGRERASHYTIENIGQQWTELFDKLITE